MDKHISTQFDNELQGISSRVLAMGGTAEAQIQMAIEALVQMDDQKVSRVIESEQRINDYELEIEGELASIIARRQPTARDLRLLMAISRMSANLERVGDESKHMACLVQSMVAADRSLRLPCTDLRVACQMAVNQLHKALDAFARLEVAACIEVLRDDRLIDEECRGFTQQLSAFMTANPFAISASLDLLLVAKSIERMGDHAKNIAECVIYIVKGVDVRHTSLAAIEAALQ